MDTAELRKRLNESKFSNQVDYFVQRVRPCVDIEIIDRSIRLGASKFGGSPDLAPGTPWPESPNGPYRFLAQIDCSELPEAVAGLPRAGLLSLFVGVDSEDGEFFWQSPGYVKAFLIPQGTQLVTVESPESVSWGESRAISFRAGIDIPHDQYQVPDWPLEHDYGLLEEYQNLRESLHVSPHYLLGFPSHYSLGYDPTPGAEWQSLLTLDSDDDLVWEWHDADKLMILIERERLARHDFSSLKSDAG